MPEIRSAQSTRVVISIAGPCPAGMESQGLLLRAGEGNQYPYAGAECKQVQPLGHFLPKQVRRQKCQPQAKAPELSGAQGADFLVLLWAGRENKKGSQSTAPHWSLGSCSRTGRSCGHQKQSEPQ